MSLFLCSECPGVKYCILITEPTPCTIPHTCTWGESLVPAKFREITHRAKEIKELLNK